MIILITGATHTGKTRLAQQMLEKTHFPYLSQDHIKMGLIRSGCTDLTPADDNKMTAYLWPITREIIKTAIENNQNLIVEGCYVPFDWKTGFTGEYLPRIRYICLCFSQDYIDSHFDDIRANASCIETRLEDGYCTKELLKRENRFYADGCRKHGLEPVMIEGSYTDAINKVLKEDSYHEA